MASKNLFLQYSNNSSINKAIKDDLESIIDVLD